MAAKKPSRCIKIGYIRGDPMKGWGLKRAHYSRLSKRGIAGRFDIYQEPKACRLYFAPADGESDDARRILGTFSSLSRAKLEVLYYEGEPAALERMVRA